jgi:hypothetical protein
MVRVTATMLRSRGNASSRARQRRADARPAPLEPADLAAGYQVSSRIASRVRERRGVLGRPGVLGRLGRGALFEQLSLPDESGGPCFRLSVGEFVDQGSEASGGGSSGRNVTRDRARIRKLMRDPRSSPLTITTPLASSVRATGG